MKKVLCLSLAMIFATSMFAQKGFNKNSKLGTVKQQSALIQKKAISNLDTYVPGQNVSNSPVARGTMSESDLLMTIYDLQSNTGVSNRAYRMDDGSMIFAGTIAEDDTYANRGSAYNYFDGSTWNEMVVERNVETVRSGWPTIAPYGNGAVLFSHSASAIESYKCEDRAAGVWTSMGSLPGSSSYAWPRTGVTVDENGNEIIHVVASNQNSETNITDLKYWRSLDGGTTWEGPSELPGFTQEDDRRFITDNVTICTNGSSIAVLFIDFASNIGYSRSDDNGETFEYHPIYEKVFEENFFYITQFVDGDTLQVWSPACGSGAIDNNGVLHVVFNTSLVQRDYTTEEGYYSYYFGGGIDGVYYWNENMGQIPTSPEFVNHIGQGMLTVDSTFHMAKADESEYLEVVGALGGSWYGAFEEGNETWPIFDDTWSTDRIYVYSQSLGISIMPTIAVDNEGRIFIAYSSLTQDGVSGGDNSLYYRRIFGREYNPYYSTPGWQENSIAITSNFIYTYSEVIYPFMTCGNNDGLQWNIFYSTDEIAGLILDPDATNAQTTPTNNYYRHSTVDKTPTGINETKATVFSMSPNPTRSNVLINVEQTSNIEIYNTVGQLVKVINNVQGEVNVDVASFTSGVYLVNVRNANGSSSAQKLIVQ